jgi:hypothetical protein
MVFEFGPHTIAAGAIEAVGTVVPSPNRPGDVHQVAVVLRSGKELTAVFSTKAEADNVREHAIANMPH